jgi:hypothetical protein
MLSKTGRIGTFYKGGGYIYELSDYLGNVRATVSKMQEGLRN